MDIKRVCVYCASSTIIAPVFVEDKTQPRHLSMIEDITERKKMEESLKKAKNGFLQP